MKIQGKNIYLKTLTQKNATKEYCDWLNDKEVNRYLETKNATIGQLKNKISQWHNDKSVLFLGIFCKDKHIGNIKLRNINNKRKTCILGILIGNKDYWGKGIGTEATRLLVNYTFNNLKFKKISLGVKIGNKYAIRIYERLGFKKIRTTKKGDLMMEAKNVQ